MVITKKEKLVWLVQDHLGSVQKGPPSVNPDQGILGIICRFCKKSIRNSPQTEWILLDVTLSPLNGVPDTKRLLIPYITNIAGILGVAIGMFLLWKFQTNSCEW